MTRPRLLLAALVLCTACGKKAAEAPAADNPQQFAAKMAQEHRNDAPAATPAAQVLPAVPVKSQAVVYGKAGGKDLTGYLAYPANAEGGLPGVLVFHEWWGLNANIKSMADQLAGQGYVALAADLYGGQVATQPDQAMALMQAALKDEDAMALNLRQAHAYLKEQIKATRVGTIGWCFGGGVSWRTALLLPEQVDAAVIYYGHVSADPSDVAKLKAPVMGFFGAADASIPVDGVKQFEAALKAAGKTAEVHVYEGAQHAFANPSGGNYKADAAADAWQRALTFLAQHLKGE
ncbi:MAG TPA: dienelactone hydrolase family protein [Candidatus Binatia bacterium]|nr:dienelactone hydrolase family protein [Candidatus Binatia bacterium]